MVARRTALVGALILMATACGDAGEPATTAPPPATEPPATSAPPPTTAAPTTTLPPATTSSTSTTSTTTTSTTSTTTTTMAATTTTLAGQAYDLFVPTPVEGPVLGVVGVRFDDMLNVRSGPGVGFPVVGALSPTATGIAGTGDGWQLPSGAVWWRIDSGSVEGWAASRFLSRIDGTTDVTSSVVGALGELPTAETMLDLGTLVAQTFVDTDVGSDVVQVTAPTVGDLGEIAFDVIGLADDSVGGARVHVFATPGDESFTLKAVELTAFCTRGLAEGICV